MDDTVAAREVFDAKVARWLRTKSGKSYSNHSLEKKSPNFYQDCDWKCKGKQVSKTDGWMKEFGFFGSLNGQQSAASVSLDDSGGEPFMNDLQNRLRKERGAADGAIIVVDLGPLQVDVKTATCVPPHNDVSDVWNRDHNK